MSFSYDWQSEVFAYKKPVDQNTKKKKKKHRKPTSPSALIVQDKEVLGAIDSATLKLNLFPVDPTQHDPKTPAADSVPAKSALKSDKTKGKKLSVSFSDADPAESTFDSSFTSELQCSSEKDKLVELRKQAKKLKKVEKKRKRKLEASNGCLAGSSEFSIDISVKNKKVKLSTSENIPCTMVGSSANGISASMNVQTKLLENIANSGNNGVNISDRAQCVMEKISNNKKRKADCNNSEKIKSPKKTKVSSGNLILTDNDKLKVNEISSSMESSKVNEKNKVTQVQSMINAEDKKKCIKTNKIKQNTDLANGHLVDKQVSDVELDKAKKKNKKALSMKRDTEEMKNNIKTDTNKHNRSVVNGNSVEKQTSDIEVSPNKPKKKKKKSLSTKPDNEEKKSDIKIDKNRHDSNHVSETSVETQSSDLEVSHKKPKKKKNKELSIRLNVEEKKNNINTDTKKQGRNPTNENAVLEQSSDVELSPSKLEKKNNSALSTKYTEEQKETNIQTNTNKQNNNIAYENSIEKLNSAVEGNPSNQKKKKANAKKSASQNEKPNKAKSVASNGKKGGTAGHCDLDDSDWSDMEDCTEEEDNRPEVEEFDDDDILDENFHQDLDKFIAGLNFDQVQKHMKQDRNGELAEDEYEDHENESEEDHEDESEEESEDENEMQSDSGEESATETAAAEHQKEMPTKTKVPLSAMALKLGASLAMFETANKSSSSQQSKTLSSADDLVQKMKNKLNVAKFRMINQQLYCSSGADALELFRKDPDSFRVYHDGFKSQVALWPLNPLNLIVDWLKQQSKDWVVADFGCGEAALSDRVKQKVHSLDLVALKPQVTVCDMANTPLKDQSVNVAVFCLSLMGTNISDFIAEANRTLKHKGILKIAEVESRINDLNEFVGLIQKFGFKCIKKPVNHNYFVSIDFKKFKHIKKEKKLPQITLNPCLYKKR